MTDANPYRAPSAEIADIRENGELELAGIGHRFGALVLDAAIAAAIIFSAAYASGTQDFVLDSEDTYSGAAEIAALGFALFIVLQSYFLKKQGQTIGKKIVGIRIVDRDGNLPGLGRLLYRRYLPVFSYNALPFVGGVLALIDCLLVFRRDRRSLHDMLAGTRVVMHGAKHSSITWFIAPLFALIAGSIAISAIEPMLDGPPPKPAAHARKTPPKIHPAAAKPPAQAAAPQAKPPSTANAPAAAQTATNPPALAQAAAAPAAPPPSEARLRKCATLGDAAAIIRCSQESR
jgi:uncharacterized RDD family membrane protein YckC